MLVELICANSHKCAGRDIALQLVKDGEEARREAEKQRALGDVPQVSNSIPGSSAVGALSPKPCSFVQAAMLLEKSKSLFERADAMNPIPVEE